MCETRCINSVQAVRYQYTDVRNVLVELAEAADNATTASEAQSLVYHMEDFSLLTFLIWHDLLFEVTLVSQNIQGELVTSHWH